MPLEVLNPFDQSIACSLDYDEGSTLSLYGYLHLTRRKSLHFRTKT